MKQLKIGDSLTCIKTYYDGAGIKFYREYKYPVSNIDMEGYWIENSTHRRRFNWSQLSEYFDTSGYSAQQPTPPQSIGNEVKPNETLTPRWLWEENRQNEVKKAIENNIKLGIKIPEEWIKEYNQFIEREM